jgi:hypothetical protein
MRKALKQPGSNLASYLYQQYADDEDLQGFVDSQNDAAQTYLDWFNSAALPYYPNLTGDLLNWVMKGLYGLDRTQLASPKTPASGMLDTVLLNTFTLNEYVASTQTFYSINDDVAKRILTWDFYKGDGKHFSVRWLKRRVMRFLAGTDGLDPRPYQVSADGTIVLNPNFQIGAESTGAIGVVFGAGTVTVSIDQSLLSLQLNLAPNILQLFKLAFEGGALELPLDYTYSVNIITNFVVVVRPTAVSSTGSAATQTTGAALAVALGGTGIYTYHWTWQVPGLASHAAVAATATGSLTAGSSALRAAAVVNTKSSADLITATNGSISIDSPNSAATTFTGTGLVFGSTVGGIAVVTVTDTVSGRVATATVLVTITRTIPAIISAEDGTPILLEDGSTLIIVES